MASEEHLEILVKGVDVWNEWRERNPEIKPDLRWVNFAKKNLAGVNLARAHLVFAKLYAVNLTGANLSEAYLGGADLRKARLSGANFIKASLFATRLRDADLSGADLRGADLAGAQFRRTNVRGANLSNARMRNTVMVALDLSEAKGLETITHRSASSIGTDTIVFSKGKIPEVFLRGAGVPEPLILQIKSLKGYEFYSCFISYASEDDKFVRRLYADLQSNHVRCWYAPEDLKIGDEFRQRIDEEIFGQDKLLLVLTENSLKSPWVKKEVETAFEKEQKQKRTVLFPIQLDEAVMDAPEAWAGDIRRMRHIGDFRGWENRNKYKIAFRRLLRDLKSEAAKG